MSWTRALLLLGAIGAAALVALALTGRDDAGESPEPLLTAPASGPHAPARDTTASEPRATPSKRPPAQPRRTRPAAAAQSFDCFDLAELAPGERPPACWRPFADASPFNRPLPAAPLLDARSDRIIAFMARYGAPDNLAANSGGSATDFAHANYFADGDDPVYEIHCTNDWGTCEPEGRRFRIPAAALPAGYESGDPELDHHLSVAQPDGTTLDLWRAERPSGSGGTLDAAWGGLSRIDGDGLGSNATAAQFGGFAGAIRPEELAAGRIDHALFAVVPCTAGYVYPAAATAAGCDSGDAPPNGARLQLAMTADEIAALAVPRWKQTVLTALARYGMIVGDTGGNGAFGLQFESGAVDRAYGRRERIDRYAAAARLPTNFNDATGREERVFDLAGGVDWEGRLRVVHPCVSAGTC
jgi:hypothetical protein